MFFWIIWFFLTTNFTILLANYDVNPDIPLENTEEYLKRYANIIEKDNHQKVRSRRQTNGDDLQGFPGPTVDFSDNQNAMWNFGEDDDILVFDNDNLNSRRPSTVTRQISFEPGVSDLQDIIPPPSMPNTGTRGPSCEERCPSTQEYNPVCGDDNVTYPNIGKLQCAVRCGRRVTLQFRGGCLTRARGK
ncbi:uncharacterized protein LOC123315564 [Coccinella septempunctata]|uniref:uncharacterized protein LOC123315564 n=1 Tax=Coccinella septempunctata TaxID=41139 RepID=UPI001D06197C|nr:uncharacterized protein LOC123315564 [Coccinella septempunctata]